ncbi:TIGR02234 family membrane protein [Streptacidiphilus sp. P02-A3a]|uniref:TIGR02234 family membrane protein n=1 Tax=Streptacidiphilus sp. P02-A3a TaxID=2704468 RepID=UPI001CDCB852|nr:TIGR02234 family membrane protein [Streptacidiphilus sp. P02-A3a]
MTALPQPRTEAPLSEAPQAEPDRPKPDRRSLALMLLFAVLGASLALLAAGRTWSRGQVGFQQAVLHVSASGSQTTGLPSALALVGLASAVAVFAVRGFGRRLLGALLALAGAGAVAVCLTAATSGAALNRRASAAVGLSSATADHVVHTAWPWAGAVGGVLLLLAGVLVITRGRDWPGMSSRYDAPARRRVVGPGAVATAGPAGRRPAREQTPADVWQALDRGEDPTE